MSGITFECRKCGTCCRNLIEDVNGMKAGLVLTVKEISLFPSEMVSPKLAIGFEKPEKTILNQLNVNDCPFITESNDCRIYDKRPLVCRQFPYKSEGFASAKCPVFFNVARGTDIEFSLIEIEAKEKMVRHTNNRIKKCRGERLRGWFFDLRTNQWVATDLKTIPL
jgi:Fe-S-cluster containining protein